MRRLAPVLKWFVSWLWALRVYRVRSGDVIIAKCHAKLTAQQQGQLANALDVVFSGRGVRCLIVDGSIELTVVRPGVPKEIA